MTTKKRLTITLAVFVFILGGLGFLLQSIITDRIGSLMEKRLISNKAEVDHLMMLDATSINSYVNENSYWDELCYAVERKDTAWVIENMQSALKQPLYNASLLWLTDDKGHTVFKDFLGKANANRSFALPQNFSLTDTFKSKIIENFCVLSNNAYTYITAASIVRGNDFYRKSKKYGYLIAGKQLDNSFLKQLNSLNSAFTYTLKPDNTTENDVIDVSAAALSFVKTIPCINGPGLKIKVSSHVPEIKVYNSYIKYSLWGFLAIVSGIIFFLFHFFIKRFFEPLIKISQALKTKSTGSIITLKTKITDLGEVARLVDTHFKQTHLLEEEINQRKKSEAELKEAFENVRKSTLEKVKAEQAADAKSEFLSIMSHEIRTPINGVIGIANLLNEEDLTQKQKEYVGILNFSAKHLLSLVSDILDFSKIEAGKVDFEKSSFDLHHICHSLYHLHKVNADEKGIKLLYTPDRNFNTALYGDAMRLNQVLTNLVGNALKFTSENGTVNLSYKLLAENENNCTIEFRVKDSGIGMTEEEIKKIFEGFSQANTQISGQFGGTGLGLTICKKLIELQGGKIQVQSKPGCGSEFIFYISFEKDAYKASTANILPAVISRTTNLLNGMKVLVAEDNKINIIVIKNFLEKWGIHYKISNTGKEAVDILQQEVFDLVLMDLHMPEMNGEDATKIIRSSSNAKVKNMPVIALTANASADTQRKLLSEGFDNYISKPFNPDTLFKLLKKYYYEN
jgi:signal transduction histidine kinase/sensor domain CHASE-containing protein/ActR/RegA family two-component response regulator